MHKASLKAAFTLIASILLTPACSEPAKAPPPENLTEVSAPEGFTFATSRPVALTVTASRELVGADRVGLAIERDDGKLLYKGPIDADKPFTISLSLPSKDRRVRVRVYTRDVELQAFATINNSVATHAFL